MVRSQGEDSSLPKPTARPPWCELVKGVHLYTAEKGCNESERAVFYAVSTFHALSCTATFMRKWSIYFHPKQGPQTRAENESEGERGGGLKKKGRDFYFRTNLIPRKENTHHIVLI